MNVFFKKDGFVSKEGIEVTPDLHLSKQILWIDLLKPTSAEISYIANAYNLDIPTKEEREEIEESARYWEDSRSIVSNTYFLVRDNEGGLVNETVTFILHKQTLFTIRYNEFRVFDEIQQVVLASPKIFEDGFDLLAKMFEARVEKDADLLESAAEDTRVLRKSVLSSEEVTDYNGTLGGISNLQELNMSVRDSLFDKRRAITAILKSNKPDPDVKKTLTIVLKDLNSLVDFTTANMNALDNIQTILTNQINIEQNKTIKLFTVVTVAMMPPTLIGTIYGMNFANMPELEWEYAYPVVLIIMVLSTIFPIVYFKKKGWL